MKTILLLILGLALGLPLGTQGQGTVVWANTPTTLITTNDLHGGSGLISGSGRYEFGLYAGPLGTAPGSLALVAVATNGAVDGRFNAANAFVPGAQPGAQLSFQIRGWLAFAGSDYFSALDYGLTGQSPAALLGQSDLGFFTVPNSGSIPLFGQGAGQVRGFELMPVPEPSAMTFTIIGFGVLTLMLQRWTSRK